MRTVWIVLGGAAAGAGLAYLFSPAGEPARRMIRDRASECAEATRQCVETTSRVLAEKAREGQRLGGEMLAQGQELAGQGMETLRKVEEAAGPAVHLARHAREAWGRAKSAGS